MSYDLKPERRMQNLKQQIDGLRNERFNHQLNVTRWEAIPEELRDGSDSEAIENAEKAIRILEAQIDALEGLMPSKNREQKRAEAHSKNPDA